MATITDVLSGITELTTSLSAIDVKLDAIKVFIDGLKVGVVTQEQLDQAAALVDSAKAIAASVLTETEALDK